jgi:hypothetical protein
VAPTTFLGAQPRSSPRSSARAHRGTRGVLPGADRLRTVVTANTERPETPSGRSARSRSELPLPETARLRITPARPSAPGNPYKTQGRPAGVVAVPHRTEISVMIAETSESTICIVHIYTHAKRCGLTRWFPRLSEGVSGRLGLGIRLGHGSGSYPRAWGAGSGRFGLKTRLRPARLREVLQSPIIQQTAGSHRRASLRGITM